MNSRWSWICLMLIAQNNLALADEGLDAYREGHYKLAAQKMISSKALDPVMQYYLGRMYLYGYGQEKNNQLAIKNIETAAEKGLMVAQKTMGSYALLQEKNPEKALYWFKKSAANDMSSQMYCAAAYLFGFGTKSNPDLAKKYYIVAAQHGNSIAQYELAKSFLETRQLANKKLGLIWLNKAVAQNNPEAQVMLAQLYLTGTLVEKNPQLAKEYINSASKQGSVAALSIMGDFYTQEKDYATAKEWYLKAIAQNYIPAYVSLAKIYAIKDTPLYNPHESFLMMLKAAQNGYPEAQIELSKMYKTGDRVVANEQLSAEWLKNSKQRVMSQDNKSSQVVQWLTLGKANNFNDTEYHLNGIFSNWHNTAFLKEKQVNPAPKMVKFSYQSLYQPQFVMLSPNEIPISAYYNALVNASALKKQPINFPRTKLVLAEDSSILPKTSHKDDFFVFGATESADVKSGSKTLDQRIKSLKDRAALGDPASQLELGLRYQYGDGVPASMDEAIKYYQLANIQHNVSATYQLATIYLTDESFIKSYKVGLELMNEAALRGLPQAQFVLGQINEYGVNNSVLKQAANHEQAIEMYKLASSNNFGLAQYRLAEVLVHQKVVDLTSDGVNQRYKLIKSLYEGAVADGVKEAFLPLAFYNAMDEKESLRSQAFAVAKEQAEKGEANAALLLALMYDRGIATKADSSLAKEWYQKASDTPVSAFVLGTYMSQGHGITKNVKEGQALLQKSADAGFMYAHFNLSILKQQQQLDFIPDLEVALQDGYSRAGVLLADYYVSLGNDAEHLKKARSLYQHFADSGDQFSQLKLAQLCERGLGGNVDWRQAGNLYQLSADQGNSIAQYLLGRLYQLGKLDSQPNIEYAHKWYTAASKTYLPAAVANGFVADTFEDDYAKARADYELAANQGNPVGQYNLGLIYEGGKGTQVDLAKATALYTAAAKQGYKPAIMRLKKVVSAWYNLNRMV